MNKILMMMCLLVIFSISVGAAEISTPLNRPKEWEGTWQKNILHAGLARIIFEEANKSGHKSVFDFWVSRHPKIEKFLEEKLNIISRKKQIENRRKWEEEQAPLLKIYRHPEKLFKKEEYEEIIKNNPDIKGITDVIKHIKHNKKRLWKEKAKELPTDIKQFVKDLEHYKSIIEKEKLNKAITNTTITGALALLARLAMLGVGL